MHNAIRNTQYAIQIKARAKWDEGAFSPELVAPIPTRAFIIKSIAMLLLIAFIVQDIAWANPQESPNMLSQSTLQIPLIFSPLRAGDVKTLIEMKLQEIVRSMTLPELKKHGYNLVMEHRGARFKIDFSTNPEGKLAADCAVLTGSPANYHFVINDDFSATLITGEISGTETKAKTVSRPRSNFEALINSDGSISIMKPMGSHNAKPKYFKAGKFSIAAEKTSLNIPYRQSDLFEVLNRDRTAGSKFEIPHCGLWAPLYDKAGDRLVIAHISREGDDYKIFPDYFIFNLDINSTSGIKPERLLYYSREGAEPVPVRIPIVSEEQLNASLSLSDLVGFVKSAMAAARLIFYFDSLLARQHGRFSAWLTEPDKLDPNSVMAIARLALPESSVNNSLAFERHKPWANIADLVVLYNKNKNALIAEFGRHKVSVQAKKNASALLALPKLNRAKDAAILPRPKRITLYADGIETDKSDYYNFNKEQQKAITKFIDTYRNVPGVSNNVMRTFLKTMQAVINNIVADLPQEEEALQQLPSRFVYIVDNAISINGNDAEKYAVVLIFRKKDENNYVVEKKGFRILPRFNSTQELLQNYRKTLQVINNLQKEKELKYFLNILLRRVGLFEKMWVSLVKSTPERRELAYKRVSNCLKEIKNSIDIAYNLKSLTKEERIALFHPFKNYLSVLSMMEQEKDKISQEIDSGEESKRIKSITRTIRAVKDKIEEYSKFQRIAYTLLDGVPVLDIEASKAVSTSAASAAQDVAEAKTGLNSETESSQNSTSPKSIKRAQNLLLSDADEIFNQYLAQHIRYPNPKYFDSHARKNDLVTGDATYSFKFQYVDGAAYQVEAGGPHGELKLIQAETVNNGYKPNHQVPTGKLTIIETNHPYRIYSNNFIICTGLALKGKRDGKNVLILGHLSSISPELINNTIRLLIEELKITDLQGILLIKSYYSNLEDIEKEIKKINGQKNLDLKIRKIKDEVGFLTDLLVTQDGIIAANFTAKAFGEIYRYKPENLEMFLWPKLSGYPAIIENTDNLLDLIGGYKSSLRYSQKTNLPIEAIKRDMQLTSSGSGGGKPGISRDIHYKQTFSNSDTSDPLTYNPDPLNLIGRYGKNSRFRAFHHGEIEETGLLERLKGMTFGERIKYLRRRKGWHSKDLAKYSRIGQTTLSRIENGHIYGIPWDSTIAKLAVTLDIEENLLLDSEDRSSGKEYKIPELPDISYGVNLFSSLLAEEIYPGTDPSVLKNKELIGEIKHFANLNEQQELVIDSIYLDGRTVEEIAEMLNVSTKRIYYIRNAALKKLRNAAESMGIWNRSGANAKPILALTTAVPKAKLSPPDRHITPGDNPEDIAPYVAGKDISSGIAAAPPVEIDKLQNTLSKLLKESSSNIFYNSFMTAMQVLDYETPIQLGGNCVYQSKVLRDNIEKAFPGIPITYLIDNRHHCLLVGSPQTGLFYLDPYLMQLKAVPVPLTDGIVETPALPSVFGEAGKIRLERKTDTLTVARLISDKRKSDGFTQTRQFKFNLNSSTSNQHHSFEDRDFAIHPEVTTLSIRAITESGEIISYVYSLKTKETYIVNSYHQKIFPQASGEFDRLLQILLKLLHTNREDFLKYVERGKEAYQILASSASKDNTEPIRFLRGIIDTKELTQNMIEGILSNLFSNKKVALTFSRKLKGMESAQLKTLVKHLDDWKREAIKDNKHMKKLLDNFIVLEYDSQEELKTLLKEKGINPEDEKNNIVFTYAPKPKDEENIVSMGEAVRPVYIVEQKGDFPSNYYYPLLEMVTISLAKELLQWDQDQLEEALAAANFDKEFFGLDPSIDKETKILIFTVLPKMERYDNNSRIDRYTRLLQFLHSA